MPLSHRWLCQCWGTGAAPGFLLNASLSLCCRRDKGEVCGQPWARVPLHQQHSSREDGERGGTPCAHTPHPPACPGAATCPTTPQGRSSPAALLSPAQSHHLLSGLQGEREAEVGDERWEGCGFTLVHGGGPWDPKPGSAPALPPCASVSPFWVWQGGGSLPLLLGGRG